MEKSQYRSEHDSVGEKAVPKDVYYGVQSLRAAENFHITGLTMHPEIINSIAEIKMASAITNYEIGLLDKKVAHAIVRACDEIVSGKLHEAFIVDPIQGGAGTSLNMNANEVIANRGNEIAGKKLPHPNDDINMSQSSNDTFPHGPWHIFRGHRHRGQALSRAIDKLVATFRRLEEENAGIVKSGRTPPAGRHAHPVLPGDQRLALLPGEGQEDAGDRPARAQGAGPGRHGRRHGPERAQGL